MLFWMLSTTIYYSGDNQKEDEDNKLDGNIDPHFTVAAISYEMVKLWVDLLHLNLRLLNPLI